MENCPLPNIEQSNVWVFFVNPVNLINAFSVVASRFPFRCKTEEPSEKCQTLAADEDEDLIVHRSSKQKFTDLIYIGEFIHAYVHTQ